MWLLVTLEKKWKLFTKTLRRSLPKHIGDSCKSVKVYLNKSVFSFHHSVLMDKYVGKVIDREIII